MEVVSDEIDFLETIEREDKTIYLFATDKITGTVEIDHESSDYAWINLEEIDEYQFLPDNEDMVEIIEQYIDDIG